MIAAFVLIAGSDELSEIVQTPVVWLYPASVLGMLKSIVFELPTAPLTSACSCELSDETASVPSETSMASRSDRVESAAVSSAVVFTVIVARSCRPSRVSTENRLRRRDLSAEFGPLMIVLSPWLISFQSGFARTVPLSVASPR